MKKFVIFLFLLFLLSLWIPSLASAEVNQDGSFSYTLPLKLPPGVNQVQPNLALVYNSNSPNGMLGIGWSLSGLPMITRMNYGKGINYDGNDTYRGPSGRLIQVDSDYHSEQESWSQYAPQEVGTTCGNGPCSWEVIDKQGNQLTFGGTEDSRIEAIGKEGGVRVWALNQFEDVHGNNYTIEYEEDTINGDYYPTMVLINLNSDNTVVS